MLPTSEVAGVQPVSDSVVSARIVSTLQPADAKGYTDDMRAAVGTIPGAQIYVSGQAAIEHDLDPVFAHDLTVGELFIAIPIALLILVFVFGTLAFLIPFVFAAAAIPTTLGIIWIFANFMELTTYLQNLVMLIGLGIAIDYSLLVVYRYREELADADSKEDAVVRTMATAGRAVVFSGTAVGIGLALMLFMPLPFMRGFGIGGLVIPLVSVVCAMTLLPVLLYFLAAKLDRVRLIPKRVVERREDQESNFWIRLSRQIMRRPVLFAAGTATFLVILALPVLTMELGPGSNKGIPQDLEGVQGLNIISDAVGEGALAPTQIAIDTGQDGGAERPGRPGRPRAARAGAEGGPGGRRDHVRRPEPPVRRRHRPLPPGAGDGEERVRVAGGAPLRRPPAGRHRPGGRLSAGRRRLRGRRAAGRRGLPRPHLRRVSRGSSSASSCSRTSCSCAPSGRC